MEFDIQALQRKFGGVMAALFVENPSSDPPFENIFGFVEDISPTDGKGSKRGAPYVQVRVFPTWESRAYAVLTEIENYVLPGRKVAELHPFFVKPKLEISYTRGLEICPPNRLEQHTELVLSVSLCHRIVGKSFLAGPAYGANFKRKLIASGDKILTETIPREKKFPTSPYETEIPDGLIKDFQHISGLLYIHRDDLCYGQRTIGIHKGNKEFWIPNPVIAKLVSPEIERWKTKS